MTNKLREQTLAYWQLSRCYEGRPGIKVTIEDALSIINENMKEMGPKRALTKRFGKIKSLIIQGAPPKKKKAKG